MAESAVVKIGLTFLDRDGNSAVVTSYCAFGTPIADMLEYATDLASYIIPLSDAVMTDIRFWWRWKVDAPAAAGINSSIERKLLLLMTNDSGDINGIMVPSPRVELWETLGNYAGIRLDMTSTGALAWINMLTNMDLLTKNADDIGLLITGGLVY